MGINQQQWNEEEWENGNRLSENEAESELDEGGRGENDETT